MGTTLGRAVFLEPLGHNPLINWYRKRTPEIRSADEHPLKKRDLMLIRGMFDHTHLEFRYCAAIGAAFLYGKPGFTQALRLGQALDRLLFLVPALRLWAWQVIIEAAK